MIYEILIWSFSDGSKTIQINEGKREIKPRDSIRPSCVNSSIRVSQLSTEYCAQSETNIEEKNGCRCGSIRTQLQAHDTHTLSIRMRMLCVVEELRCLSCWNGLSVGYVVSANEVSCSTRFSIEST